MYRKWSDFVVSQSFICYCPSLLLTSTNTLAYSGIHTLLTCKVFKLGSRVLHHKIFYGRSKLTCLSQLIIFTLVEGSFERDTTWISSSFACKFYTWVQIYNVIFVNHRRYFSQSYEITGLMLILSYTTPKTVLQYCYHT